MYKWALGSYINICLKIHIEIVGNVHMEKYE